MLSVVIPALNAERHIGAVLASVQGADEVMVVDGGSSDGTPAIAEASGARVIQSLPGRGVQLHLGAAHAAGEWLLFLHADTVLSSNWRAAVVRHVGQESEKAACFQFQLASSDWRARLIERAVALRVRLFALPYGDQGLLISRELYQVIGGFQALPIMEDVDLVRRIGRSRLAILDASAITSAQRWQDDGWFARSARNATCLTLFTFGMAPQRIARLYG